MRYTALLAGSVTAWVGMFGYPSIFPTGTTRYDPTRGEIVWEYVSAYFARSNIGGMRPTAHGPQEVVTT